MAVSSSDTLVFFGATGDLAYEQIFPSLQGLVRDGLNVPIIGVSRSGMKKPGCSKLFLPWSRRMLCAAGITATFLCPGLDPVPRWRPSWP
jgi:glucose-6-phosphate 1-dehydrogenase